MVSFASSTYEKSKQFNKILKELQKTIKPINIRTYLNAENQNKKIELNLTDDEKIRINELNELRISGIQAEMKYALAQAKKNGIDLSEEIISGKAIFPNIDKELLDKVPSLRVYELFMLFTEEELDYCVIKNISENTTQS